MTPTDSKFRLAILTRHFWPQCGPAEMSIADLATSAQQSGFQTEILTICWDKNWSRTFRFRDLVVTRISRSVNGPWGMFRYLRRLNQHVQDSNFDAIVVFGLQRESWAAIRNFSKQMPVVCYIDGREFAPKKPLRLAPNQIIILKSTARILVDCPATARMLSDQGLAVEDSSVVPWPVLMESEAPRSAARQAIARSELTDAHPILQIEPDQPLAICGANQFADPGLMDLVQAWPRVLEQFPEAKLWVLGDGFKARRVWEKICELAIADSVIMPGFFDDWEEILQAADIYIHPLRNGFGCPGLNRALAAGICCVATAATPADLVNSCHQKGQDGASVPTEISNWLITKNGNGLLTPQANPAAMAEAILCAFNDENLRNRLGQDARAEANEQFNVFHRLKQFVEPVVTAQ